MNSFISWVGGKKSLRKDIVDRFPQERPSRYIEVFGGAGWVLFHKDKHADLEVYNDVNGELVNLFRCVKNHADELQRNILQLNSRELFEDYRARQGSRGLTDIQRAAEYFMLIRTSFGSTRTSYGCNKKGIRSAVEFLGEVQRRLEYVVIENKDFESLIKVYDRPRALIYCDPPYHTSEKYYQVGFDESHHERLRDVLSGIRGKFLLSYNDDEYIRQLYKDFNVEAISRSNNLGNSNGVGGRFKELIIKNY